MKINHMILGVLIGICLVSCASQTSKDKDIAVDEALGTGGYEEQATEAQQEMQDIQAERRKEQQKYLERQITDPTF